MIADLLQSEEGKTLEFKRDLSSPKKLLKTLVAFANTAGGTVIIGVDDTTRQPMGLDQPLDEEERLCSLIADSISPRLVPDVEMITVEGRTLLVVHADYSQRGARVRIAFFDDRIEIENPGILLPGMTIDDMRQGISKIRNHVIARVFRELKLVEQWGRGVRRMFREAEEQGLPAPQILEVGMRMRFTVPLAEPLIAQMPKEQVDSQERPESRPESRPELQLESRLESQLAAKVLLRLQDGESGKPALAEYLGHRTVSGELKKQIKRLLDFDLIEMTIPDRPNSRLQKYRLTAKGKKLLAEQEGAG